MKKEIIFVEELRQNKFISKKLKKVYQTLNYIKNFYFYWMCLHFFSFFFQVFRFFNFFKNKYTKNKFTNVTNIKIQQNVYKIRK